MSMDLPSSMSNSVHVSLLSLQLFFKDWDKNVDGISECLQQMGMMD